MKTMIDIKKTPTLRALQATAKMGTISIGICSVMKSALKFKFERYAEKVIGDSRAEFTFTNVNPDEAERAVRFLKQQFKILKHQVAFNRASEQHRLVIECAI